MDKLIETLASGDSKLHYASALALGKIGYSWEPASNLLRPSSDEWFLIVQSKTIHRMGRQCAVARGSTYLAVSVQSRSRSFFLKTAFTRLEVFDLASALKRVTVSAPTTGGVRWRYWSWCHRR